MVLVSEYGAVQKPVIMPINILKLVIETETPVNRSDHLWSQCRTIWTDTQHNVLALFNDRPPRVDILDPKTLELLYTWGTEGKGPGEFTGVFTWIGILNDTVYVYDARKVKKFLVDGTYLDKDVWLLNMMPDAALASYKAFGIDNKGYIYYKDADPRSKYLISKLHTSGNNISGIINKSRIDIKTDFISFRVLGDGSIIVAFKNLVVNRYTSDGELYWHTNLIENIPYLVNEYKRVESGEILFPISTFWVDERYTILTVANPRKEIGAPNILYIFLNTHNGQIEKIASNDENIIHEGNDNYILYNPSAIAHANGYLYAFANNSSKLFKYQILGK